MKNTVDRQSGVGKANGRGSSSSLLKLSRNFRSTTALSRLAVASALAATPQTVGAQTIDVPPDQTLTSSTNFDDINFTAEGTLDGTGTLFIQGLGAIDVLGPFTGTIEAPIAFGGGSNIVINGDGGTGTLVLTGVNNFGAATLSAGTLSLQGNSVLGSGLNAADGTTVDFGNGITIADPMTISGTVAFNQTGGSATQSGSVSGTGGINKTGDGILTLSAPNTYAGGTVLSAGTLALGIRHDSLGTGTLTTADGTTLDVSAVSSLGPAISNDISISGTLTINQATNGNGPVLDGIISGTGGFVKTGQGGLTLRGNKTFLGGIDVQNGYISLDGSNAAGTGTISTADGTSIGLDGGTVANNIVISGTTNIFQSGGSATLSGVISGTGTWDKGGGGVITVTNSHTFTGPLNLLAGTLNLSGSGSVVTDTVLISGGFTRLETDGGAFLSAPSITINSEFFSADAVLEVNGDETIGSLTGIDSLSTGDAEPVVEINGVGTTLTFGDVTDTTFDGEITGTGNLVKQGSGTFTLTRTNTLSGNTTVNGGTLVVNGSLSGPVTVNNNGFLGGIGTFGSDVTINSGGTLAPGNSIGTTTVAGNLTFDPGSSYAIEIDSSGNSDLTNVGGSATINGGTVAVSGTPGAGTTYTIFNATSGVSGTFDGVTGGSLFSGYALSYDPNNVFLSAVQTATLCSLAGTPDQRAVACDGLESLSQSNDIVQAIMALNTQDEAQAAYDALSGQAHASIKGALMENGQHTVKAVNERIQAAFGSTSGTLDVTSAFGELSTLSDGYNGAWLTGYGLWSDTDGTGNTAGADNDVAGVVFGVDRGLGDFWRVGVLGGYSRTHLSQDALSSSGTTDSWSLGLYGGATVGATGLSFGAIHNWHSIDMNRTIIFPGVNQALGANYDARSWQLFAQAGHKLELDRVLLEPFAGISYISLNTDGFTESGGSAALTASSDTQSTTFTTLGIRTVLGVTDRIQTTGMIGWRHAFGDIDPLSIVSLAGSNPFTVTGAPIAEDALVTELGFEAKLSENAFLSASYDGQFGNGATTHGFNADFLLEF